MEKKKITHKIKRRGFNFVLKCDFHESFPDFLEEIDRYFCIVEDEERFKCARILRNAVIQLLFVGTGSRGGSEEGEEDGMFRCISLHRRWTVLRETRTFEYLINFQLSAGGSHKFRSALVAV